MAIKHTAFLLAILGSNAFAAADQDIKTLMEQGKFSEAYQLGKQNQDQLGEAAFDFYFGIAALDGGNPGEGILALERFLLSHPENRSARFHLARGYYILGEDQRAHREFFDLLADANTEEQIGIERFLDAIRARESRYQPTATFFAETGIGYDSNINAGVRSGDVAGLPGFAVTGRSSSVQESDTFYSLQTGVQGSAPVSPGVMLYGGLTGNGRWYADARNSVFEQTGMVAQGGVSILDGRNLYRSGLEHNLLTLDRETYLRSTSLIGEWAHQFDQFNRFGLSLQYAWLRYEDITIYLDKEKMYSAPSGAPQRDSNMTTFSANWTRGFAHAWNPIINLAATLGQERNQRDRDEYSRNLAGFRANASIQPHQKLGFAAAFSYINSRYQDNFFAVSQFPKRKDDYLGFEINGVYSLNRNWSIKAEATYAEQNSNIGLYEYDRNTFAIKLRYDYK